MSVIMSDQLVRTHHGFYTIKDYVLPVLSPQTLEDAIRDLLAPVSNTEKLPHSE